MRSVHSLTHMQPLTQIRDVHGIFVIGLAFVILPRAADKPVSPGGREQVALVSVLANRLCCVTSIGEGRGIFEHGIEVAYMYIYMYCSVLSMHPWALGIHAKMGVGCVHGEAMSMSNVLIVLYQSCSDCLSVCCLGVMSLKLLVLVLSLLVVILAMVIHSLWT